MVNSVVPVAPIVSASSSLSKKSFLDPAGVICACFMAIPGVLLGQIIGVTGFLSYAWICSPLMGMVFAGFGYYVTKSSKGADKAANLESFFRALAVSLATALGGLWGGATAGPLFIFLGLFIPANQILLSCIVLAAAIFALCTLVTLKLKRPKGPEGFVTLANGFMFMVLGASIGMRFSPIGWIIGLNIGLVFGLITGSICNNSNFLYGGSSTKKVLTNIYAISGLLTGIMFGAIMNAILFASSLAWASSILGVGFMLIGGCVGHRVATKLDVKKGNTEVDLDNKELRHKLYKSSLLIPTLFLGYLTGGLIGYLAFPGAEILLCQAFGTVASSILYLTVTSLYTPVIDFLKRLFHKEAPEKALIEQEKLNPDSKPTIESVKKPTRTFANLVSHTKAGDLLSASRPAIPSVIPNSEKINRRCSIC